MLFKLLFFNYLVSVFSISPLWNFENTVIDLLSENEEHKYYIYYNVIDSITIKIEKTISKTGDSITETNTIYRR